MSSVVNLTDARLRNITLPADDGVAQDILDEQEAWLAARIGALTGERSQTFYVGLAVAHGKLALARYTDAVTLTDGGHAVTDTHFRLVDRGSAVHHTYSAASQWWSGPYVIATYEPNDLALVRSALYALVALAADPPTSMQSETLGDYSYTNGQGGTSITAQKAAIVAGILPKHDPLVTLFPARRVSAYDPVINRAEPV